MPDRAAVPARDRGAVDADPGAAAVQHLEAVGVPGAGPGIAVQALDLAGPGVVQGNASVPAAALAGAAADPGIVARVAASLESAAVHETVKLKEAVPSLGTEAAQNPGSAADQRNTVGQSPNDAAVRSQRAVAVVPSPGDTAGPDQMDAADPSPRNGADRRPRNTAPSLMNVATAKIAADPNPRNVVTASARADPCLQSMVSERADRSPRNAAARTPGIVVVAVAEATMTATSGTAAAVADRATEMLAAHRTAPGKWPRTGRIRGHGRGHAAQETSTVHRHQMEQSPMVIVRCARPNETAARAPNRRTPTETCENCLVLFPLLGREKACHSPCPFLQIHVNLTCLPSLHRFMG